MWRSSDKGKEKKIRNTGDSKQQVKLKEKKKRKF